MLAFGVVSGLFAQGLFGLIEDAGFVGVLGVTAVAMAAMAMAICFSVPLPSLPVPRKLRLNRL